MGSGTRTTDSQVANQPTLQSTSWKPFPTNQASTLRTCVETSSGAFAGKPQLRSGQKSTIRLSSHSVNASWLSVSVSVTSPFMPSTITLPDVRLDGRRQRHDLLLHHGLALPEVRLDGHSDNVLLDNVFMVKAGGISILHFLQSINDLVDARVNFHHFDIQSWLHRERHGHYHRSLAFEFHSL